MPAGDHGGNGVGWRRRFIGALPAAALLAVALPLRAAAAAAPLRVVTLCIEPFGSFDAAGRAVGVYVDLAASLSRESGIAFSNTVAPYPRAMAMMERGDADLVFSIPNSKLEQVARPLLALFKGDIVIVGRAGTRYKDLADLHGKMVGQIRGAEYVPAFLSDTAISKHETISTEQTMRMLLEGRLDAAIGFRHAMFYSLRSMKVAREKLGPTLLLTQLDVFMYLARSIRDPVIAATLLKAMTALRDRGVVKDILERYFGGLPKE